MRKYKTLRDKIEAHLDTTSSPTGCWLWTRSTNPRGYGHLWWEGKCLDVHRAYLKELGWDVPDGMDIDHLCRVTGCTNPDHLEVVTRKVNAQRGIAGTWDRGRFCKRGHEYTEENTYRDRYGRRTCRTCKRIKGRRRGPCAICGEEFSLSNIADHRRRRHPEGAT